MALIADTRVRAKAKFTSTHTSDTYEIHVIDSSFDNSVDPEIELKLDRDGFVLDYGGTDDIQYIMGSELSMGFLVSNSDEEDLASDILSLQEDRFGLRVYKNENLYWHGMIYQDGVQIDVQHKPYVCRLTAMCGLGRLKQIAKGFPNEDTENAGNLATIVIDILKETDPLQLGDPEVFMRSMVDFRSSSHDSYTIQYDTLVETFSLPDPIFYKSVGNEVTFSTRSYFDGLERILKPFFSRILMQDGAFNIIPIQKYKQTGSIQCREFSRSYQLLVGADPTVGTAIDYTTRTLVEVFTNEDNLKGLSMGYEEACDQIVTTEKFDKEVNNAQNIHLEFNSDSHTFTTGDNGYLEFVLNCGNYRFENTGASDLEVWAELKLVISTVYSGQTWYWGPQRDMTPGTAYGQPISSFYGWSTTQRWITLSQTNYFETLKTGTSPYPYHTYSRGDIDAGELDIIQSTTGPSGREIYAINWLAGGLGSNVVHVIHPSGGSGSVTLKVQHVALNKSDNLVNSDIDTDSPITQAEFNAAGITNGFQGTKVNSNVVAATSNLLHLIETGESGRSVKIKDIGDFMLADQRNNNVPTQMKAWDGTNWDSKTTDWAEAGDTPDGPLVQLVLREWATIFQKPVKRPDMAYVSDMDVLGQVVPAGKPFPIGTLSSSNNYMPVRSKFLARDGVREETWIELDTNEVSNSISTTNSNVEPFIVEDGTNLEGGLAGPSDTPDSEGYPSGIGTGIDPG